MDINGLSESLLLKVIVVTGKTCTGAPSGNRHYLTLGHQLILGQQPSLLISTDLTMKC